MDHLDDAIIRQQIYVEAVKRNEGAQFRPLMDEISKILANILRGYPIETMGELTKTKFNTLLVKIRKALLKVTRPSSKRMLQRLYDFLKGDLKVSRVLFRSRLNSDDADDEDKDDATDPLLLWANINSDIVPAFGGTIEDTYSGFFAGMIGSIIQMLSTSYVENRNVSLVIRQMFGTASLNFKDGLAHKYITQFNSVVATAMQHITNQVSSTIAQLYFNTYRWISILDSHTTKICRSRANHIYVYGEGPIPPAHYGCRSRVVPVAEVNRPAPDTFLAWVFGQSTQFQNFALGRSNAQQLRAGNLTTEQYPRFVNVRNMTTSQYVASAATING